MLHFSRCSYIFLNIYRITVNPSFSILVIFGLMLVGGGAISTVIVPVLANDLTPEDLLSLQDPLQEKVTICHIPNGDPSKAHEITVGASAVPTHLAHGDTVGPCVTQPPPPPPQTTKVIVTKEVRGGSASPEQFTICVSADDDTIGQSTPATPPCAPGSASGFTYIVIGPGSIVLREPVLAPGYVFGGYICDPGETGETVMCTVFNQFTG
jgi:hypothetical protein